MTQKKAVNGAELLVRCLEAHGVEYIFGIPGAKVDAIFDVLAEHGPRLILCRHEQNAAFMAGAVGKLTGKPGVCLVTSGPGITNLPTGLSTATSEGCPVIAIGGNVPRAMKYKHTHQVLDNAALMKPVTKFSIEVMDGNTIPEIVANAYRTALMGRPGAAFISIPQDVLTGPVDAEPIDTRISPLLGVAEKSLVKKASELINHAKRPVVFAGMLASRPEAAKAFRELISQHPMPVVTTYEAAGVLSRELIYCHVGRIGLFQNQPGDRLIREADLIVTIGFDPIEYDPVVWNHDKKQGLIHISEYPADIDTYYQPAVELIGHIAYNVRALSRQVRLSCGDPTADPFVIKQQDAILEAKVKGAKLSGSPVHPLRFIYELRRMIDDDVTVICDVGSVYVWMGRYFHSFEPNHLLFSNGQQTLGVALPWAMATTLVRPGKKVISISGDGGFLFTSMDLETAVREKCSFVHIIWRDDSFNMVKIQQVLKYKRDFGVNFGYIDFVKYAEAFGAAGMRINSPDEIAPTIEKALMMKGPVLIDLPVDYSDNLSLCETMQESAIV